MPNQAHYDEGRRYLLAAERPAGDAYELAAHVKTVAMEVGRPVAKARYQYDYNLIRNRSFRDDLMAPGTTRPTATTG